VKATQQVGSCAQVDGFGRQRWSRRRCAEVSREQATRVLQGDRFLDCQRNRRSERLPEAGVPRLSGRKILKAEPSLGLSVKKGDPSVQRKHGETDPKAHLAEQVAGANAHGR
jgi:hypothetical protein